MLNDCDIKKGSPSTEMVIKPITVCSIYLFFFSLNKQQSQARDL